MQNRAPLFRTNNGEEKGTRSLIVTTNNNNTNERDRADKEI